MNIVTGGTGLLGSHLLFELSKKGEPIKAIYRSEKRIHLVEQLFQYYDPENWKELYQHISWVEGDIMDISLLNELIEEDAIVYHCAALVSFDRKDFNDLMRVNRTGTENVVNTCLTNNVKKLCYVSSTAAVVGDGAVQVSESINWKKTPDTSYYSISKYSAEREVWRGMEEGLNAVIVNPCVIVGAGDWNDSSLTIFRTVSKALSYYPPGSNATVDARDVARIMIKLVDLDIRNERFLCIGSNQSFEQLIRVISRTLGVKEPSKKLSRWKANLVRNLLAITSLVTRKRPAMTKETVNNLFSHREYSNAKLLKTIDYTFYTLEEQVENAVKGRLYSKNS